MTERLSQWRPHDPNSTVYDWVFCRLFPLRQTKTRMSTVISNRKLHMIKVKIYLHAIPTKEITLVTCYNYTASQWCVAMLHQLPWCKSLWHKTVIQRHTTHIFTTQCRVKNVITTLCHLKPNKGQHRKLEKKLFPMLLPGMEPATFRSRVRHSTNWAIPAPTIIIPTVSHTRGGQSAAMHFWHTGHTVNTNAVY